MTTRADPTPLSEHFRLCDCLRLCRRQQGLSLFLERTDLLVDRLQPLVLPDHAGLQGRRDGLPIPLPQRGEGREARPSHRLVDPV